MSITKIEWADMTINPVVGCSKVSSGCDNCYAERRAAMLARNPNPKIAAKYAGVVDASGKWSGGISEPDYSVFDRLPKTPKRVFIGSMTDLFFSGTNDYGRKAINTTCGKELEFAPDTMHVRIAQILVRIAKYPQHTFMFLTKRPKEMGEAMELLLERPLPNLWLGVTVCNQAEADEKIPVLLETPAAKRFVSVEPMLEPVDIGKYIYGSYECALSCGTRKPYDYLPEIRCISCGFEGPDDYETWGNGNSRVCPECNNETDFDEVCPDCGTYMVTEHPDTPNIDWVICGAETGAGKRRMELEWALSLRDQCRRYFSKTPFFFKKDSAGVRLLDGREWNEVPV